MLCFSLEIFTYSCLCANLEAKFDVLFTIFIYRTDIRFFFSDNNWYSYAHSRIMNLKISPIGQSIRLYYRLIKSWMFTGFANHFIFLLIISTLIMYFRTPHSKIS